MLLSLIVAAAITPLAVGTQTWLVWVPDKVKP